MTFSKKIKELTVPIIAIGGFLGAVQDIISPLNKFGIWAGLVFISLGVFLIVVPESSRPGAFIKGLSDHWKTPLVFSFFILGAIIFTAASFSAKNVEKGGKGVLADNISAFSLLQKEILSLTKETNEIVKDTNKVVKDTNTVVKDTNTVVKETNVVVKTTQVVVQETKADVKVILENTKMTATKALAEHSYSTSDHYDFFRAVDELEGDKLTEILKLYSEAQFNLSRKIKVYPDLFTDNNDRNLQLLRMPKRANLVHGLIYLDYPIEKILAVLNIFEGSEQLTTPVADWYAYQAINPDMTTMASMMVHFHPQSVLGDQASSVDRSLISYPRSRANNDTTKRGKYTLVHTAAAIGDIDLLKVLLKRGHNLNQLTISGYTPLALAIENEQVEMAQFILNKTSDFSTNNYVAYEIALIKMLDGYYPFEGYSKPVTDKSPAFGSPKENPYYLIAKSMSKKISSKPTTVLTSVKELYVKHVNVIKKASLEHRKYPGSHSDKMYQNRIKLGQEYLNILSAF